jgi:hypothetical protein
VRPEESSGEGFTVRDRRGDRAEAEPVRPPGHEARGVGGPSSGPEPEAGAPEGSEFPPEPDLAALFLLLANSAIVQLSGESPAAGGGAPLDLAQAKFSIDLLRLLREKTEGNRTADETQLLDELLYDLQLRFVQAVGSR